MNSLDEHLTKWMNWVGTFAICQNHLAMTKFFLNKKQKKVAETHLHLAYSYYNDLVQSIPSNTDSRIGQ